MLRLPLDEILLAALGRTIAQTVGDGVVAVDLGGPGRSVLKPDVDLRRTVGWLHNRLPGRSHLREATSSASATSYWTMCTRR